MLRRMDTTPILAAPEFRTLGRADAPIVIHEFSDFACPYCKTATEYAERLVEANKGGVRLNFKHYPLTEIHPWAVSAAAHADCAGKQGKFWEYGELLFKNQKAWSKSARKPAQFEEYARRLALDYPKLARCVNDPETIKGIELDTAEGGLKGINVTPTFFIKNKRAVGRKQLSDLAAGYKELVIVQQEAR